MRILVSISCGMTSGLLCIVFTGAGQVNAQVNEARAQFHYQMFCQGCHGADGSGSRTVPVIRESIGAFLTSQEGREYLIRVPGVANSPLHNAQLAELMNWTIMQFAGDSIPDGWQGYASSEVGEYRQRSLYEVVSYRQQLLATLITTGNR